MPLRPICFVSFGISPCGASFFLGGQKETKKPPGGELRMGTLCPYLPSLSPLAFGHLPLTRGVGPLAPHFTGPQSGRLGGYRKGAGGSADCFSLVFRCRSLGRRRRHSTPLAESAFGAVGLKLCGGGTAGGWGHPPLQGNRKRGVSERPHGAAPTRGPKSAPSSVWPGGQPPSPLGEGLGGAGFGPPPLARQTQAHKWNRTSGNFCKARAQWPGRNRGGHSLFSRRKFC